MGSDLDVSIKDAARRYVGARIGSGDLEARVAALEEQMDENRRLNERLSDLLDDTRQGEPRHHLRRLWADPITGGPWGLLRTEDGRIRGVYSNSPNKPLTGPESVNAYPEWLFDVPDVPVASAQGASAPGVKVAPGP